MSSSKKRGDKRIARGKIRIAVVLVAIVVVLAAAIAGGVYFFKIKPGRDVRVRRTDGGGGEGGSGGGGGEAVASEAVASEAVASEAIANEGPSVAQDEPRDDEPLPAREGNSFAVQKASSGDYIPLHKADLRRIREFMREKKQTRSRIFVCARGQTLEVDGVDDGIDASEVGLLQLFTPLKTRIIKGNRIILGKCAYAPEVIRDTMLTSERDDAVRAVAWEPHYRKIGYDGKFFAVGMVDKSKLYVGCKICVEGSKTFKVRHVDQNLIDGASYVYLDRTLAGEGARIMVGDYVVVGECAI